MKDQKKEINLFERILDWIGGDFKLCRLAGNICIETNFLEIVEGIKIFYCFKTRDWTLYAVLQVWKHMQINGANANEFK